MNSFLAGLLVGLVIASGYFSIQSPERAMIECRYEAARLAVGAPLPKPLPDEYSGTSTGKRWRDELLTEIRENIAVENCMANKRFRFDRSLATPAWRRDWSW